MPTHIALLRGINVGGHNKVAMADLREVVRSLGHTDVATYIQSGNVVFSCPETETATLSNALEHAIAEDLGVRVRAVVLSRGELARVIAANPFPEETSPKCLHAVFRGEEFGPDEVTAVTVAVQRARERGGREDAHVMGRTLFLHTPDGLARSELATKLVRPEAGTTARNWATVTKLMTLLDA
ncbi:uncharacterized protein (DUF1697 family) [Halopolyspora algeriensis]|uniref:Uncharacterized protein (DUF1697 family) n=1 Tax=Halopolyspora algeriensis TaxID=1500506 RepID=A0A368VYU3_9ACTN|nr:DUF1697 domain-containing protein [Halopolyspora algeriensis]RCW47167.1 uncharacterized protein (DUF1697 family) [Halopolyspora algeriensis]TQM48253.1 uncharacterized protein (DUF1697 family) [Halopolyspora algeriensis]